MAKEKVSEKRALTQITIDIWKDQKETMELIREKQGSPVSFQIRDALEKCLPKTK